MNILVLVLGSKNQVSFFLLLLLVVVVIQVICTLHRLVSKGCKLVGCGSAVPTLQISNDDLSKIVDTSDEWISVRTGIRRRRVLSG